MSPETRQRGDLIDELVTDHREVEQAFADYERGGLSDEQRRSLVDHIITELVRHSVAEEQYLYPAARQTLPDGAELADHEIAEHAEAEELMKRLEGLNPTDADFDHLTRQLIDEVRHHVEEEERDLFPRLKQACTREQLDELGDKITSAKKVAPTRPHPSAPDRPPANMLLDPGVGLIDRMRDALSHRGR
ncbi:hemerythrin domain-containing protein [Saccharopolyspora phatthalungensis]|uniref:Hemerythrin superfamily protein n=1 Tax=Saccharopolyspora phatthalungensis TaxID=664693 RepID=A0A840Q871_9PSEU|nr:hemerythrin domain-containing protein [Saccharopolyspora phatthalungensis]MBB5156924.1 hemerythrin superfamily protein [Saccharopolyspora phatthalungensis]